MKKIELKRSEEMLLALLRAALHQRDAETVYFQQATEEDWVRCYRLAVRQGVSALAWEGIERLPLEDTPPLDVKVSWALLEKKQLATYRKHGRAVNELTQLYAQHGIATVVLKGVGLSRLYPVPAHREGGDIDIYTYSADQSRMTDEEANRLADELMEKQGIEVSRSAEGKDSHFLFHQILIENHRFFFDTKRFPVATEVEEWLEEHIQAQMVDLADGECQVNVPSIAFDSVYVSYHAALHAGIGLSLQHLCDLAMLFKHGENLPKNLSDRRFYYPVSVFAQLCNEYLGTHVMVEGDGKMTAKIMREILRLPYQAMIPYENPIQSCIYKTKRTLHCLALMRGLLKPTLGEMVLPLLKLIFKHPGRLIR
jgi:hypothetical protein